MVGVKCQLQRTLEIIQCTHSRHDFWKVHFKKNERFLNVDLGWNIKFQMFEMIHARVNFKKVIQDLTLRK